MKKQKILLLLFGLLMFNIGFAQNADRQARRAEMQKQREAQFEKMVASLELSEDQSTEMKSILQDYQKKMRDARMEASGDRESMREIMMKLRDEQNNEVKDILTAEQFEGYQKFMKEQRGNRRGPRGDGKGKKKESGM